MRRKNNIYILIMILLAVSIGIGYSYLQTNLTMIGHVTVRKYDPPRLLYNEIVAQNQENGEMVLDNQSSTYVSASTGIDFAVASSDTNGKGVYVRNGTESDTYPVYYYRGEVINNNVLFAGFCWKIVRTTETGGIKLIYNGVTTDGTCNNTGEASQIGTSTFNSSYNYNAYVGYMYGTPNSSTYDAEHLSTKTSTSSTIKIYIDKWYSSKMTNYTSYLEDTIWCNDRSITTYNSTTGTGAGTSVTYYSAYTRNYESSMTGPNLECVNQNDRFTVNETMEGRVNGNAALIYPVALLTADELTLVGNGNQGYSSSSYLTTGQYWWSLSPYYFSGVYAYGFYVYSSGDLTIDRVRSTRGVRPSVSLKNGTEISKIGDGSANSPFVVDVGEKIITVEGNDDIIPNAVLNRGLPGTTITLSSKSGRNSINSFKMNGELVEGISFIMPEGDVLITDIDVTTTNSLYEIIVNRNKAMDGLMVLDNQASTYVGASTGIDFNVAPSDTNGKGVYVRNGTESDTYPVYYYRGAVTNNNVLFGGFCWKIVRTTETGGIKLIYNGVTTDGTCNNTGEASQIGTSTFNSSYNYNAYVGYMYGTPGSSTYEAEHLSTKTSTSSTIKTAIDTWYAANMASYTDKLEDTVWCNDRSITTYNSTTGTGAGTSVTYYSAYTRNYESSMTGPNLECVNQNDRFTVNETMEGRVNGNAALIYPVALLTADELTLAGNGNQGYSSSSYLTTGQYWWSLSPYYFSGVYAYGFYVYSSGDLTIDRVRSTRGVRPSVSLKLGTKISAIGDGSVNSPFIVE